MNGMVIRNMHVFGGDITMLPQLSSNQLVCQVIMLDLLVGASENALDCDMLILAHLCLSLKEFRILINRMRPFRI